MYNGDVHWLTEGLKKVDKKLQRLGEINEFMAFKPWGIDTSHIEFLMKCEMQQELNFSVPELLQSCAILAYYHSLCGLIFGQGIKEDVDIAMSFEKSVKALSMESMTPSLDIAYQSEEKTIMFL